MVKQYWRQVHRRAFADAAKAFGLETRTHLAIKGLAILAAILALLFLGSVDASKDELIGRVAIVAFLVLAFPFVYVWKFISTPALLEKESHELNMARFADLNARMNTISERLDAMPDPDLLLVGETERKSLVIKNRNADADFVVKIDYSDVNQFGIPETPVFAQWADNSPAEKKRIEAGSQDRAVIFRTELDHTFLIATNHYQWVADGQSHSRHSTSWVVTKDNDTIPPQGRIKLIVSSTPQMVGGSRILIFDFKAARISHILGEAQLSQWPPDTPALIS